MRQMSYCDTVINNEASAEVPVAEGLSHAPDMLHPALIGATAGSDIDVQR